MQIIKRNGESMEYLPEKIITAIEKANAEVETPARISHHLIQAIVEEITDELSMRPDATGVEEIQDLVIRKLMTHGAVVVGTVYMEYRYKHQLKREANTTDNAILSLIELANEEAKVENANKNPVINSTQRDYMAGEVSKDLTRRVLLPEDIVKAHDEGIIHFHDSDYFAQHMHNCCLVNLEDMLQNGTVITGTRICKPHSFYTACNIATQVVAQVASSQYGGQTISLSALAPFVEVSRQSYIKAIKGELESVGAELSEEKIREMAEIRVKDEIRRGVQTIQYQLITLMTTNGQAPFVSVVMYLDEVEDGQTRTDLAAVIEEVLRQRIQGVQNEQGIWITPAFPKLLYFLDEDNTYEGSKYFYLTQLAAKCTVKRMVPDYISVKEMKKLKNGDVYGCMGCRSFLTVDRASEVVGNVAHALNYVEGKHKYYGRFNQGVVTINLPDVACASNGNMEKFWEILDERLELCHRALRCRHERLLGTPSDVAPILWQHGALARLKPGEVIDPLLYNGYSTISLGYSGLYETCMRMTGMSHTDEKAKPFALAVMQKLNDKCSEWKAAENIDYSVYGTPMESTTYKFAKVTRRRYGLIKEVTDHNYQTNSYHVCVREKINAFDKLTTEAQFQRLSPGGAISYVEMASLMHNIEAVVSVIQHIYENIMYAEMNTKSDYCQKCGYEGEIQIVEDESSPLDSTGKHKLIWRCPNCGNTNHDKMNVARRVCGYIGTNDFNQGRMGDVKDRVLHI